MNVAKNVLALLVVVGLLAAAGCTQNQEKVQGLEEQVTELQQENDRLSVELTSTMTTLEAKDVELTASQAAAAKANDETADMKKQLAAKSASARKDATNLEKMLTELRAAHKKVLADSMTVAAKAAAEIQAMEKQLAQVAKEVEEARKALEAAEKAKEAEQEPPPENP